MIGTNTLFINGSDMNTTVLNVIDDCHDQVHFTQRLIKSYWSNFDGNLNDMMNELNKHIYDQFVRSIGQINIPDDIKLLTQFMDEANIPDISDKIRQINGDLNVIETILTNISIGEPTLPQTLVQATITQVS